MKKEDLEPAISIGGNLYNSGNIDIATEKKPHVTIKCTCGGEPLTISGGGEWVVNIKGDWEFTHNCGKIIKIPSDLNLEYTYL